MTAFVVWGLGPSSSAIVRAGAAADGDEYVVAFERATCAIDDPRVQSWMRGGGDAWTVVVECDGDDLDAETRHDPAALGYDRLRADLIAACEARRAGDGPGFGELVTAVEAARETAS